LSSARKLRMPSTPGSARSCTTNARRWGLLRFANLVHVADLERGGC
jgi:hypothetical protein